MNFPIVDTHLHIWDPGHIRYPWLDNVPFLNKPFLIDDYRKACAPIEVEKMVFVQAEADFSLFREEVDWVSEVALSDPRIRGIVAWAPLEKGADAEPDLAYLAKNPLVRSIRRIIQFEPDPEFCLKSGFIEGVRILPRYGLSFDICINHLQMANTIRLIEKCPDVSFILDHIGKPDIKNGVLEPWKTHLKTMSRFPNLYCKMSGLVTEADHENWTDDVLRPYIDHVMDCFGYERTMFGGDWPVAFQATEYPRWVTTLERSLKGAREKQLRRIFRENAESFYRV